jgi:hypothetical protein
MWSKIDEVSPKIKTHPLPRTGKPLAILVTTSFGVTLPLCVWREPQITAFRIRRRVTVTKNGPVLESLAAIGRTLLTPIGRQPNAILPRLMCVILGHRPVLVIVQVVANGACVVLPPFVALRLGFLLLTRAVATFLRRRMVVQTGTVADLNDDSGSQLLDTFHLSGPEYFVILADQLAITHCPIGNAPISRTRLGVASHIRLRSRRGLQMGTPFRWERLGRGFSDTFDNRRLYAAATGLATLVVTDNFPGVLLLLFVVWPMVDDCLVRRCC